MAKDDPSISAGRPAQARSGMPQTSPAEASSAVLSAVVMLQYTVKGALERYHCTHLSRAFAALNQLLAPGCSPSSSPHDTTKLDLLGRLTLINSELEFARDTFRKDRCSGAGEAVLIHGLLEYAVELADRLFAAYNELPQSLELLCSLGSFTGATKTGIGINASDAASPITATSPLVQGGQRACELLVLCSFDIEAAAHAVTALGDQISDSEQIHIASLIRCYGARIVKLNSVLMSYLTGDDVITLADAQHALYQGAKRLPEGKL